MSDLTKDQTQLELSKLGKRLRALRTNNGWTLEDLAKRTGVSEPHLSRMESGERQPSITVLVSLAKAYDLELSSLFGAAQISPTQHRSLRVIRAGSTPVQKGNGLLYISLAANDRLTTLHPIQIRVPANRKSNLLYEHEGEEWLYVLSGELGLVIVDEEYTLQKGDSAHFDAQTPHRLFAIGNDDAEIILVAAATPRQLLGSYL